TYTDMTPPGIRVAKPSLRIDQASRVDPRIAPVEAARLSVAVNRPGPDLTASAGLPPPLDWSMIDICQSTQSHTHYRSSVAGRRARALAGGRTIRPPGPPRLTAGAGVPGRARSAAAASALGAVMAPASPVLLRSPTGCARRRAAVSP